MSKKELIIMIQTLTESLNETYKLQFQNLNLKKKDELLSILQSIQDFYNKKNINEIEEIL
jgi:hypothetical protein